MKALLLTLATMQWTAAMMTGDMLRAKRSIRHIETLKDA